MNSSQVRELLHPFADGELPPEEMEAVRAALADLPDCQLELKELEATNLFAREAFMGPVADVDFSNLFDGVMARVDAEEAAEAVAAPVAKAEPTPSLWVRFTTWFDGVIRFEQPLQSLGAMAAILLMVGGAFYLVGPGDGSEAMTPGGSSAPAPIIAGDDSKAQKNLKNSARRPMEREQEMVRSGGAAVESYEVAEGQLVIEGGEDNVPVVVWHVEEATGDDSQPAPAPAGLE